MRNFLNVGFPGQTGSVEFPPWSFRLLSAVYSKWHRSCHKTTKIAGSGACNWNCMHCYSISNITIMLLCSAPLSTVPWYWLWSFWT
jgi:hypothetical protein